VGARYAMGPSLAALALLVWIDFVPHHEWERIERVHEAYLSRTREIASGLAPDARLATAHGPHFEVYLDRPVYSLEHAVRRSGRIETVEEVIDRYGIDTVAFASTPTDQPFIAYFREHNRGILKAGTVWVFRVRP
jgi:hypothetical protein